MNLIVNALLDGLYFLVAAITNFFYFLPDASLPSGFLTSFQSFGVGMSILSGLIPFDDVGVCVFILCAELVAIGIFKFIQFGLKFIPLM